MTLEKMAGGKGGMTVSEAGRKGGIRVRETRGRKFYQEIGKKGGEAVKARRGTPFYEEIGRKGGHRVHDLVERAKDAAREGDDEGKPRLSAAGDDPSPSAPC